MADAGSSTLAPPSTGEGEQFTTPATNVPPGQPGAWYCEYVKMATATNIVGFQSLLSPGVDEVVVGTVPTGPTQPTGALQACGGVTVAPVYIGTESGRVETFAMPAGVGLPIAADAELEIFEHLVNPTPTALSPTVEVNVFSADAVQSKAGVMVAYNTNVYVPAQSSGCGADGGCPDGDVAPGMQVVQGACTAPAGSQFFWMTTETGSHATAASFSFVSGGQSTELVHTGTSANYPVDQEPGTGSDWQHPGVGLFCPPKTVSSGDTFKYSCSYVNTGSTLVTVGSSLQSSDRCVMVSYYYPAGTTSCD